MSWWNRLSNMLRRDDLGTELDEELQFHIDARVRDNLKAGMTEEAARRCQTALWQLDLGKRKDARNEHHRGYPNGRP